MGLYTILIKNIKKIMKPSFLFIFLILDCFCFADEWRTIKEKKTTYQYIIISENNEGLYTFAASTTYVDGTVVFYCHAGLSDKKILMDVYSVCEKQLERDEFYDIFKYSTEYIQMLRTTDTIKAISFNTDSPEYIEPGVPVIKSHLYLASWLEK